MNRVKAAFFAFLSVPDPKDHARYNWWHSSDHMAENMTLPGVCYGARYVATPELAAARSVADPSLAGAQYLVTYQMDGEPVDRIIQEHHALNNRLREAGRDFPRKVHFISPFTYLSGHTAPGTDVIPEALLWRPHTGLYVVMADLLDMGRFKAIEEWFHNVHFHDMLSIKGFSGVWRYVGRDGTYAGFKNSRARFLHIYFIDGDPMESIADMRAKQPKWAAAGRALAPADRNVLFAGAFQTIVHKQYDWFEAKAGAAAARR